MDASYHRRKVSFNVSEERSPFIDAPQDYLQLIATLVVCNSRRWYAVGTSLACSSSCAPSFGGTSTGGAVGQPWLLVLPAVSGDYVTTSGHADKHSTDTRAKNHLSWWKGLCLSVAPKPSLGCYAAVGSSSLLIGLYYRRVAYSSILRGLLISDAHSPQVGLYHNRIYFLQVYPFGAPQQILFG